MFKKKRSIDFQFRNNISDGLFDMIEQGSSGVPYKVPMRVEGFVGDAKEYLIRQTEKFM